MTNIQREMKTVKISLYMAIIRIYFQNCGLNIVIK